MHKESDLLLKSIGELVKRVRSGTMDQTELGKRVGVSRTTISSIERGIGVDSKALFNVISFYTSINNSSNYSRLSKYIYHINVKWYFT